MLLGFLSDAHGNDEGVDRCLKALWQLGAQQIYFLGDSVGYMPRETAVLGHLRNAGAVCVRGNHEQMMLGELPVPHVAASEYRLAEARMRLDAEWLAWIREWPVQRDVSIDGSQLLLVHGSPTEPSTGYLYEDTNLSPLAGLPYAAVFCGHTHRPFVRNVGNVMCVNVGSCGMPRDTGNLASCALFDTRSNVAELIRVEFDSEQLIAALGDQVSDSVVNCLRRRASTPVPGRLIHV